MQATQGRPPNTGFTVPQPESIIDRSCFIWMGQPNLDERNAIGVNLRLKPLDIGPLLDVGHEVLPKQYRFQRRISPHPQPFSPCEKGA
jgi:hypothetical protein